MEDDHIEEVQLDLEVEEPPAPQPEPELDAAEESDPATEAFARLGGEMAMVRHTVQNIARERADIVIPDYTSTLGQMAAQLAQVSRTLTAIGNKPAIELTPEDIGGQIKRLARHAATAATFSGKAAKTWTMQPVGSRQLSGVSAPRTSRSVRPGASQA